MQISKHEMIRAKVQEIMSGRSGWSGPIGMRMTAGSVEDETGGAGGLLDEAAGAGEGGDSGGDGGGDNGGGGGTGGSEEETWEHREARLRREFESEMDRRITSAVQTVTRRLSGQQQNGSQNGGGNDDGGDGDNGGQQQQRQRRQSGPSDGDVRESRLAYREYVTDGFRFLGDVEREHAMTMAQAMLPTLLAGGMDPDEAGREAAKKVRTAVQGLRKHYEGQTVAALKRKGLLPEDARPGQPPASTSTTRKPGDQSGYQAGAAKAGELFPDRQKSQTQN